MNKYSHKNDTRDWMVHKKIVLRNRIFLYEGVISNQKKKTPSSNHV